MKPTSLIAVLLLSPLLQAAPLKVYVLAGQSNMQGHASVTTFDYLARDPETAPLLAKMRGKDGTPTVCDGVWISYLSQGRGGEDEVREGKLTAGFGARTDTIGPEFTFGITMDEIHEEPVLLIKTAWGGKSLHTDFRPPSASPEGAGTFYRMMIDHVKKVLADPGKVVPGYDKGDGFEISGFVWFQGWNDLVDQKAYPQRGKPGGYDLYTTNMAHFIRDVRKDLDAPGMPFVIGVLGVNGPVEAIQPRYQSIYESFRAAQAAAASMPEFKGNVAAVHTEKFWDLELAAVREKKERTPEEEEIAKGASNQGFHYFGAAKFFGPAGKAFAEAFRDLK